MNPRWEHQSDHFPFSCFGVSAAYDEKQDKVVLSMSFLWSSPGEGDGKQEVWTSFIYGSIGSLNAPDWVSTITAQATRSF